MIHTSTNTPLPLARSMAILVGVCAACAAVAAGVLTSLGLTAHVPVALGTGAGCLLAAMVALVPVRLMSANQADGAVLGFLVGVMIRMMLSGGVMALLVLGAGWPLVSVGLWTAGWYLAMLAAEVTVVYRYLSAHNDNTQTMEPAA
ncbi:MAG: hypothetical protein GC159_01475 [Phycisphaera sp.]|nr:hypothetical protein [Phycisphaera sp.]